VPGFKGNANGHDMQPGGGERGRGQGFWVKGGQDCRQQLKQNIDINT